MWKWLLKKTWIVLQFLVLAYVMTALSAWSDSLHHRGELTTEKVVLILGLTGLQLAFFIWYAFRHHLLTKEAFSWKLLKTSLLGILGILVGNALLHTLLNLVGLGIETTANQEAILSLVGSYPAILLFVQSVLVAPLLEEIVFRGILGELLFGKTVWAYILPAVIFSLAHRPTDIGSFLVYAWPGFFFYFLYRRIGRLEVPILAHMIMNGLAFMMAYLIHYGILVP